jgi:DNA-binding PadR family transcriptional regulator
VSKGSYLGEFEQLVLLAIAHQADGYGVTILEEIQQRTGRAPAIGAVYATLARLEAKGYVRSWLGPATGERGGRAKRHFALKPAGERALDQTRRTLERMWHGLDWPRPEGV